MNFIKKFFTKKQTKTFKSRKLNENLYLLIKDVYNKKNFTENEQIILNDGLVAVKELSKPLKVAKAAASQRKALNMMSLVLNKLISEKNSKIYLEKN